MYKAGTEVIIEDPDAAGHGAMLALSIGISSFALSVMCFSSWLFAHRYTRKSLNGFGSIVLDLVRK